jgi:cytochrome c oxidase cbb3-type subunit 3
MPAFGGMLDDKSRQAVKHYVLSLSNREHDNSLASSGATTFGTVCAACHGQDGKGNVALGAPNLTDEVWLFGGTHNAIDDTLKNGRNGRMPAHIDILGEQKAHVVAADVYSLSQSTTN